MQFKCDTCKEMKDVGEVVRTKPYAAERKVKCYDCFDREELAEQNKKRNYAFQWLKDILSGKR